MSDYAELPKRLRESTKTCPDPKCAFCPTYRKAADAIEALTAERDELLRDNAALRELMNCYNLGGWTDAERLMRERDELRTALRELVRLYDEKNEIRLWQEIDAAHCAARALLTGADK